MKTHRVEKGECFSSLAEMYGFHDPLELYSHPDNSEIKAKRTNPNLLSEGDKVKIPDKVKKEVDGAAGSKHKFQAKGIRTHLKLLVEDFEGNALAGKAYELEVGNESFSGTTGSDGLVDHVVLASAKQGSLKVWLDSEKTSSLMWNLDIGDLEPHDQNRGVQARLNNLGFSCGDVDGIIGPNTKAAIKAFKKKNGMSPDDVLDTATKDKIKQVYGF